MKWFWVPQLLLMLSALAQAESLFVHSAKAPLLEQPLFQSETLLVLQTGAEVVLLEKQNRWLKVEYQQQQGWVSALLVKNHPPLEKARLIGSDAVTLEGQARRRASAVATAGATRGLSQGEGTTGLASDYEELIAMESLVIPDQIMADFAYELSEAQDE